MRALFIILCLALPFQIIAEGCSGAGLIVGNYYGRAASPGVIGTQYFPKYSTYTITVLGNPSCTNYLRKVAIYMNDILIAKRDTGSSYVWTFVFGAYPGHYRVETELWPFWWLFTWNFEIADNPTGLKDLQENVELAVYPNPATSNINVQSSTEIHSLELFNLNGSKIVNTTCQSMSEELPLDEYPPGIYFLHVGLVGERTVIKKIVIQ